MKKIKILNALLLIVILILCSCTNDVVDDSFIAKKSPKQEKGEVFTVTPNGVDDTQNLKDAFADAIAEGPGNTVYLTEGTFYTGLLIIEDFDGYFKGAGKGNTTIISLTDQPCADQFAKDMVPTLITFSTGFPKVSDMTIEVVESPCQAYLMPFGGYISQTLVLTMLVGPHAIDATFDCSNGPVVEDSNSSIDNVEFRVNGQYETSFYHYGIGGYEALSDENCVGWPKTINGTHTVTNCDFYGTVDAGNFGGVNIYQLVDANVVIGGSPHNANNFNTYFALDATDNNNSQIEISYNEMNTDYGLQIFGGFLGAVYELPYWPLASYHIMHNNIRTNLDAIWNEDYGLFAGQKTLDVLIEKNNFIMDESQSIIPGLYAHDVVVRNNKFSGTSDLGIYIGTAGVTCSNWMLKGNNFNKLTTGSSPPIWLGPDSIHCTVIGGNNKVNVLDEGTDNILKGVTHKAKPAGLTKRKAMIVKRDLVRPKRR